jgi:hypothetical protein
MAITINFAGASLSKPGSYSNLTVAQAGVATPAVGTVALIGEADAGVPFSEEKGLSAVSFGPDELGAIKEKFGSGPLVDAARLAISPSNDPQIRGGAQEIVLLKTNQSTKASLVVKKGGDDYGTISHKKAGVLGNSISYKCATVGGKVVITLTVPGQNPLVSTELGDKPLMTVRCTDTAASSVTMSITDTHLTTTVSGGTAPSLSIPLAENKTIQALVAKIKAMPGYEAAPASNEAANKTVDRLDRISALDAVDIKGVSYGIKQDAAEVRDFFAQKAEDIEFSQAMKSGLPSACPETFLSGGTKGATSNANILDCLDALLKRRVNFIVPLFSRDADDDIADNLTDAASSYMIDSVHAATTSHVAEASTVKGRKERQAWVGFKGTMDESVEKAAGLNSSRVSMCIQDVDVLDSLGNVEPMQPHMLAVVSAGMHAAAAIGLSTTFKSPAILGFQHSEFEPETQAEKGIAANLTFVERAPNGGFRFVLDNNTYASDTSAWIYNRPSVIFAGDFAAYAVRLSTEQYVGQRNSDVSTESIKNLLVGVFDGLRSLGVIVGDANTGGKGYKDLSVSLNGSVVSISVTMSLVENFEFILSDLKVQRAG